MAIIGRDSAATVEVDDERVSRQHVRLEPRREGWRAFDTSTNGIFVDGIRRSSVLISGATTVYLGAPDGVAVGLTPQHRSQVPPEESTQVMRPFDGEGEQWWDNESDPGVIRAGSAVAERRQQLGISQRSLDRDGIINAGALIKFEKGRSWPRRSTLEKLEKVLDWPTGHITRIRRGAAPAPTSGAIQTGPVAPAGEEATEVFTDSVQAPLMAETVELAMHTLLTAISELPEPTDPDFSPKATKTLADLRKLERLASSAARNAKGSPSVILALSSVRRSYNDLMMRAARSPAATLGQRLYGARHRAELSLQEAANGAGLPVSVLEDAEAERPIAPEAARAIDNLIGQLSIG
ncbi:DNA-binding helix-turn-helix protein [Mycobacterium parascrofulaceum ATCC BAA-614]|uniref:DNA-binding helix-turn-helix protein n=1 Tax=Mycobacterium parascrofulaceum ATCC BAA-614 TaxID=525368 RepID=D5P2G0_9MYCO|nr:DNA-binding helix-turn-helix protein [Mycobacterium parascrofulaceum ATCC BAA-614]